MRIGIIGAGHVGQTLARHFAFAHHDVLIANSRDPQTLVAFANQFGGRVLEATPASAAAASDLIVLAIPFGHRVELPMSQMDGKVVVDATNYDPDRDGHLDALDSGATTSSELIQGQLPASHVVKSFNAMRWDHLRDYGHSAGAGMRYGIPLSSDDPVAKHIVEDLIEQMGFGPVDAGDLAHGGRKHQPGSPAFDTDLSAEELTTTVGRPSYE